MIKRGHYQSKASLNSENPEIIRVLGPNKKKPNYYKIQGESDKSEFEIENEYIFLETAGVDVTIPKVDIFKFEPIEPSATSDIKEPENFGPAITINHELTTNSDNNIGVFQPTVQPTLQPTLQPTQKQIPSTIDVQILLDNQQVILKSLQEIKDSVSLKTTEKKIDLTVPINDISEILNKIRVSNTDGVRNIEVPVLIPLKYDLSKVESLVSLFEFPMIDVLETLVRKSLSDSIDLLIKNICVSLQESLKAGPSQNLINEITAKNPDTNDTSNTTKNESPINTGNRTDIIDTDITIDSGINSIDDFLNQFK